MGFESLRTVAIHSNNEIDYGQDDLNVPAYLQNVEPAIRQLGDFDYGHLVLVDRRLPTKKKAEKLTEAKRKYPLHRWILKETTIGDLPRKLEICSAHHINFFEENSYVLELEPPCLEEGRPPRLDLSRGAWDAFLAQASVLAAIIDECRVFNNRTRRTPVFKELTEKIIVAVCGHIDGNDDRRGTQLLRYKDGLLVSPRTFDKQRDAFYAEPVTESTARGHGRVRIKSFYGKRRKTITDRIKVEINAWAEFLGERFSPDGLILWCAQTTALLRLHATDLTYRERLEYKISGTIFSKGQNTQQESKEAYTREENRRLLDKLTAGNQPYIAPDIKRPWSSITDNMISILAGGICLEDEAVHWNDDAHYRSFLQIPLELVAGWVGELKRQHRALLTPHIAVLIDDMISDEPGDRNELRGLMDLNGGPDALAFVKRQLPDEVWRQIVEFSMNLEPPRSVEVHYRWNDNPTDPVILRRNRNRITIVGPMIDLMVQDHGEWTRRAELFRERGSLTA